MAITQKGIRECDTANESQEDVCREAHLAGDK